MYIITVYTGGSYKFDEFREFIEDLGGLILKKDCFQLIRGLYFLSEEIHVLTIIPYKDKEATIKKTKEIKGILEFPDFNEENRIKILSCLPLIDILSKNGSWMSKSEIKNTIKCPCETPICSEDEICCTEYMAEVLDGMVQMGMIEICEIQGNLKYKIIKTEN
ncbi:methyl-coenzyme M reductase family protein [Methanobacterium alcaliphilum]|uniref:methyl-coenzyme M reductase family protein n=1 Tax=Methanobacterium alcaliphilum TaxID=392018 RepID=UPI00200B8499|nr:methyl-coenzyme M reductase family protein [Methanobacterium alcaliphilum]MCK9152476.1 hypothetical protein [Methanobacterium alcaliphilum]